MAGAPGGWWRQHLHHSPPLMVSLLCAYFAVQSPPAPHNCGAPWLFLSHYLFFFIWSPSSLLHLCLPPPKNPSTHSSSAHSAQSSPPAPPPCCYGIVALLTAQTSCGSGYFTAKSSLSLHQSHIWLQFRDCRGEVKKMLRCLQKSVDSILSRAVLVLSEAAQCIQDFSSSLYQHVQYTRLVTRI